MVGEHFPSGWNGRQVFIDFIGGTSSLTGEVVDSTATGCVVELAPEGKSREFPARRIFTHGPPYGPSNSWRSCTSRVGRRMCPGLSNHRSTLSLRTFGKIMNLLGAR
jgi:hypothetical protein